MLFFLDIWFYVSSVCFQERLYTFRGKPSMIAGTIGMCYMFAPIILLWIRSIPAFEAFFNDNPSILITVDFLVLALLFWVMYSFYRSNHRGLRLIAKYRNHISRIWQVVTIWLIYIIVLIPFIWFINYRLILFLM